MKPFAVDRMLLPLRLARARRRRAFVRERDLGPPLVATAFDLDFPEGEVAYNGIGAAPDGTIWFAVSTKGLDRGARLFTFDGVTRTVADLDRALSDGRSIPHGKVHVDLVPFRGAMLGATHLGYYDPHSREERPGSAPGRAPYPGGIVFAVENGRVTPIAHAPAGEGILTMSVDAARGLAYALTWPSGMFLVIDLARFEVRESGGVAAALQKSRICRSIGIEPVSGHAFWSDDDGRIARFDGETIAVVGSMPRRDIWRKVAWHPERRAFFGVAWSSGSLFRFDPATNACEEIGVLPAPATLGFVLEGDTIHALVPGPGVVRETAIQLASTVNYMTIDLATGATTSRGPLRLDDGRYVTEAQSLLLARGAAYALAWVEVPERDRSERARRIRALRRDTPEFRTRGYAEEIALIRFAAK